MSHTAYNKDYYGGKTSNYSMGYDSLFFRMNCLLRVRAIINMLRNFKNSGKLLDVGCAYGFITNYFSGSGYDVVGLDISNHAIKMAQSKFPHLNFMQGNIQKQTKFDNEEFDAIVALDVLEHCKDLKKSLSEIKRILNKNGVLLISTPIPELENAIDNDVTHIWGHLTLNEWIDIIRKNKFEVIDMKTFLEPLKGIKPDWCTTFVLFKPI